MSVTGNGGGQAFPSETSLGMTMRDWFAGQVLAGAVGHWLDVSATDAEIAKWSYEIADAVLAARKAK